VKNVQKKLFKVWKYLNINFRGSSLNDCEVIDFFYNNIKHILIFTIQA